jgi:tetratricopeptide (TPR) repeat protein
LAFARLAVIEVSLRVAAFRTYHGLPELEPLPEHEHAGSWLCALLAQAKANAPALRPKPGRQWLADNVDVRRQTVDGWSKGTPMRHDKIKEVAAALGPLLPGSDGLARSLRWHYARWSIRRVADHALGAPFAAYFFACWAPLTNMFMSGFARLHPAADERRSQALHIMATGRVHVSFLRLHAAELIWSAGPDNEEWIKALVVDDYEYVADQADLGARMVRARLICADAREAKARIAVLQEVSRIVPRSACALTEWLRDAAPDERDVVDEAPLRDEAWAHDARAWQALLFRDVELALRHWRRAIELEHDAPFWRYGMAVALRKTGRLDEALAELSRACELGPAWEEPYIERASLHLEQGDPAEAEKALELAIECCGESSPELLFALARIRYRAGNLDAAEELLNRAREDGRDGAAPYVVELAAVVAHRQGKRNDAARLAKRAAHFGHTRAVALIECEKTRKAVKGQPHSELLDELTARAW